METVSGSDGSREGGTVSAGKGDMEKPASAAEQKARCCHRSPGTGQGLLAEAVATSQCPALWPGDGLHSSLACGVLWHQGFSVPVGRQACEMETRCLVELTLGNVDNNRD